MLHESVFNREDNLSHNSISLNMLKLFHLDISVCLKKTKMKWKSIRLKDRNFHSPILFLFSFLETISNL